MILVTGSAVASSEAELPELLALSLQHVRRSREEPGCLSHAVHHDAENRLRLVFVERWADADALRAHFAVPASGGFVKAAGALVSEPPTIEIYEAEEATL